MATLHPTVTVVDADGQPITGDAGHLTLHVITDGVAAAYAGTITELVAGEYEVDVTQAGLFQKVIGTSSTSGAIVVPASWKNDPALAGANTVTLTITDDSDAPLQGIEVTVHNSAQTDDGLVKVTDANGEAVFGLDDGDYQVVLRSTPAYTPANPYALTVDGTTDLTCEVATTTVPAPADPAYCTVYAWVIGQGGQYPTGTLEVVRVVSPADTEAGQTVVLEDDSAAISAANGYCALTILRGAVVDLRLADADGNTLQARSRRLVPDAATANWVDLVAV